MAKETTVRRKGAVKILAAFPGSRKVKYHGNMFSEAGVADDLFCIAPYGLYVAIEWKRSAKEEPTLLQQKFLYDINKAGGLGISTHDGNEAIKEIRKHVRKTENRIVRLSTGRRKTRKKT